MGVEVVVVLLICGLVIGGVILVAYQEDVERFNKGKLEQAIREMKTRGADRNAQSQYLSFITGLLLPPDGYRDALGTALSILEVYPSDKGIRDQFLGFLNRIPVGTQLNTEYTYRQILNLLATDSSPQMKQFVLQVARWHYARLRQDRKLTIYDEHAIQNDILVSSKT
jgi:hypothetical protein